MEYTNLGPTLLDKVNLKRKTLLLISEVLVTYKTLNFSEYYCDLEGTYLLKGLRIDGEMGTATYNPESKDTGVVHVLVKKESITDAEWCEYVFYLSENDYKDCQQVSLPLYSDDELEIGILYVQEPKSKNVSKNLLTDFDNYSFLTINNVTYETGKAEVLPTDTPSAEPEPLPEITASSKRAWTLPEEV